MSIEKNLKYILEEHEVEKAKLERLNNFIHSEEFKLKTDETQKELIIKMREFVHIIKLKIFLSLFEAFHIRLRKFHVKME